MTTASDFDDLDIVIHSRNGCFLASIPQINLYAAGASIPAAVESLQQKKEDLLDNLATAGRLDDFQIRANASQFGVARDRSSFIDFRRALGFIAKTVVVVLAVVIGANLISRQVSEATRRMSQFGGAKFWGNLEKELVRASDPKAEMAPERKQELLAEIHTVVERWRPFVREASLLFAAPEKPAAGQQ